jgi:hypothetical protein
MTSDDLKKAGGPRPPAERTRGKETTRSHNYLGTIPRAARDRRAADRSGERGGGVVVRTNSRPLRRLAEYSRGIPADWTRIFCTRPGTDVWVNFDDLPKATEDALWKAHSSKLAFPAGL